MICGGDKALVVGRIALLFAALGLAIVALLAGEAAAMVLTFLAGAVACLAWFASAARALGRLVMPTARASAGEPKQH